MRRGQSRTRRISGLFWLAFVLISTVSVGVSPAFSQTETAQPEEPSTPSEAKPEAETPSEQKAAEEKSSDGESLEEAEKIAPPKNSPLPREPRGTEEIFDAAALTVQIGRLDAAKIYLKQFLAAKPDDATISQLRRKHGPALFLKMANLKDLQPESQQLLEMTNRAFSKQVSDPEQIKLRINDLLGDVPTREAAYVELRGAGLVAIPGIIHELHQTEDPRLQEWLTRLLSGMKSIAVPPVTGMLESDSPRVVLQSIQILDQIGDPRAVEHLWYFAASQNQSETIRATARGAIQHLSRKKISFENAPLNELKRLIRGYNQGHSIGEPDLDGMVTVWGWDPVAQTVVAKKMTPAEGSTAAALKFARQGVELVPQDLEIQTIYLASFLESQVQIADGIYTPAEGPGTAFEAATSAGPDIVAQTLKIALVDRRTPAAVAACRILGRIGGIPQLQMQGGTLPPLVSALGDHDPRIQYEAAQAIVKMMPESKFIHSSRVVEILARALVSESDSARTGLIADPSEERGASIVGMARLLGVETQLVLTGRDAFRAASSGTVPDIILVNANVIHWNLTETISNLRSDARTASIPIVIYGRSVNAGEVDRPLAESALDQSIQIKFRIAAAQELDREINTSGIPLQPDTVNRLKKSIEGTGDEDLKKAFTQVIQSQAKLESVVKPITGLSPGELRSKKIRQKYAKAMQADPRLFFIDEPISTDDLKAQLNDFLIQMKSQELGMNERQRESRLAAVALAEIGQSRLSTIFPLAPSEDLLILGSRNPEVLYDVIKAMSVLNTPAINHRLAEIALDESLEPGQRVRAIEALTSQVQMSSVDLGSTLLKRLDHLAGSTPDEKLHAALISLFGSLRGKSGSVSQ